MARENRKEKEKEHSVGWCLATVARIKRRICAKHGNAFLPLERLTAQSESASVIRLALIASSSPLRRRAIRETLCDRLLRSCTRARTTRRRTEEPALCSRYFVDEDEGSDDGGGNDGDGFGAGRWR